MIALDTAAPPARPDRPSTRVLHDEPNLRVIAFHLRPGQSVPPHHSASTVLVQVVTGSGRFVGDEAEATLRAGESAVYRPGETPLHRGAGRASRVSRRPGAPPGLSRES